MGGGVYSAQRASEAAGARQMRNETRGLQTTGLAAITVGHHLNGRAERAVDKLVAKLEHYQLNDDAATASRCGSRATSAAASAA